AKRVGSIRRVRGIHAYKSAEKDGEWLTLTEAAKACNVTPHRIRSLIAAGILRAQQVVPGAPYQINASDLRDPGVTTAMRRKGRPCQSPPESQILTFTDT
ncbi:helix-turn-helix domain-containing protein, partial [Rhizobium mesoamericanum]